MAVLEIETGARLHFGLLAVRASTGRQFGGCGLMVDGCGTRVHMSLAARDEVVASAVWAPRIEQAIRVQSVPQHVGLGSGTQMALAVARGLSELSGHDFDGAALAEVVGRGKRSAIGLHGFALGGFLIEAGKRRDEISPIAVHREFPAEWRFVLVRSPGAVGISGEAEVAGFARLKPMPTETTDRMCRILLMEILPALAQLDFDGFAEALYDYGQVVGGYFAKIQGGTFADPAMKTLCEWLRPRGLHGVVQTSWGPTIAIACSSPDHADAVTLRLADSAWAGSHIQIVSPRNHGATVVHL
jgi:beta-ribofuranosylaminobenzene 5'-phosphate synthase